MGKILITGPGRSGTTFLVMLLTRLGFDTGYEPGEEAYYPNIRAGCEKVVELDSLTADEARQALAEAPRVLKSPEWGIQLKDLLRQRIIQVDHVILPVRDLDIAAKSRLAVDLDWLLEPTQGDKQEYQANVHALALGRAIEACLLYNVPCTTMKFPLLVQDEEYCYQKLNGVESIDREEFRVMFQELARPEQIEHG